MNKKPKITVIRYANGEVDEMYTVEGNYIKRFAKTQAELKNTYVLSITVEDKTTEREVVNI